MSKLEDAREILEMLKVPVKQKNDMCCYTLLAMAGLSENKDWQSATNEWMRIHDVIYKRTISCSLCGKQP